MAKHLEPADWPTGLCDCCSDQDTCVQGLLPCVLFGKNARKLGVLNEDDPCAAFCMMCTCAYGLCGLIGMGCAAVCAGSSLYMVRAALRARAGLKEAPCSDCLVVYCCGPCAACQEARILKMLDEREVVHAAPPEQHMHKGVDVPTQPDHKQEAPAMQATEMVPPGMQRFVA